MRRLRIDETNFAIAMIVIGVVLLGVAFVGG